MARVPVKSFRGLRGVGALGLSASLRVKGHTRFLSGIAHLLAFHTSHTHADNQETSDKTASCSFFVHCGLQRGCADSRERPHLYRICLCNIRMLDCVIIIIKS